MCISEYCTDGFWVIIKCVYTVSVYQIYESTIFANLLSGICRISDQP